MKNQIFGILILCFSISATLPAQDQSAFPEAWCGEWTGELEIFGAVGLLRKIPMSLSIQPTDSTDLFSWKLVYGSGAESSIRPYLLKVIDRQSGQYVIDEQNSIILQAYLLGGKLYNRFKVGDNLLLTTTELVEDRLIFEVISGKDDPIKTTGGEMINGEEIPPVDGYEIMVRQRAILKR